MEKNREIINQDITTIVFYMKGGVNYNDAWLLTTPQRKTMARVVEKHYEAMNGEKKNQL